MLQMAAVHATFWKLRAGETVYKAGGESKGLYVVARGEVCPASTPPNKINITAYPAAPSHSLANTHPHSGSRPYAARSPAPSTRARSAPP